MLKNIWLRKTLTVAFLAFAAGNSAAQKMLIDTDLNNLITFDIGTRTFDQKVITMTNAAINANFGANITPGGNYITDIAYVGNQLYGITHTSLYTIDTTSGVTTFAGSLLPPNANDLGFTSLVSSANGTGLYAASRFGPTGIASGALYSVDLTQQPLASGLAHPLAPDPTIASSNCPNPSDPTNCVVVRDPKNLAFFSSGDLAYVGSTLYLSSVTGPNTFDNLVTLNDQTGTLTNTVGSLGLTNVWGLATFNGSLYAGAHNGIYTVNLTNAATNLYATFDSATYGNVNGAVYDGAAGPIPEPGTYAMLLAGLGVMGLLARRRLPNVAG